MVSPTVSAPIERAEVALHIEILGSFQISRGAKPLPRLPKKTQALVAYLALQRGRPFGRDALASLLWEDSTTEQSRQSLRQSLTSLRGILGMGESPIQPMGLDMIVCPASTTIQVDVERVEELARSDRLDDLLGASRLFRDELLAGLAIRGEAFNDWLTIERQRLASQHSQLLERLANAQAVADDLPAAIDTARQLTMLDPLREEGHRLLIRHLAATGERAAALKHYARCVDILHEELGLAPSSATSELAQAVRAGTSLAPFGQPSRLISLPASPQPSGREKASIVVLPFSNLSGDMAQDYLADGLTEDVTIALGREKWLFVIASASALALKDRTGEPLHVGSELGVRYVLRGSVRLAGDRVRIVVQLTDSAVGGHLWSTRFEDHLDNVFSMQDRLTNQVAAMIAPALRSAEVERVRHKPTESLTAYELYLSALPLCRRSLGHNRHAITLLMQATALDPHYGAAYGLAARCYHFRRIQGWSYPDERELLKGLSFARLAIENGGDDSEALWMAGLAIAMISGELVEGLRFIDKSLALNPSSANAWIASCFARSYLRDTETALAHFALAQQLNPVDSTQHIQWHAGAMAHFVAGRYEEADAASDKTLNEIHDYPGALRLKIATCGLLGRDARLFVRRLIEVNPDASLAMIRAYWKDIMAGIPDVAEMFVEGCRKAGLSEKPARI